MPHRSIFLLRLTLAFVWIHTGIICLAVLPVDETAGLATRVGFDHAVARWIVWLTSLFEIGLGLVVAAGVWRRPIAIVQLALILGFTLLITLFLPEYWLHPFGPVSKNAVLLSAVVATGFRATCGAGGTPAPQVPQSNPRR